MAPIRTAIIGLSAQAVTAWASSGHLPYLLSECGRAKYQIVALCNSSVDAAKAAIAKYNLGSDTRAYGDPVALAEDKDVELVVCNTRVDKHYETVLPSLRAGKHVFVEWPLADNIERVRELAQLAREKGVRSVVGLQGQLTPVILELRRIIDSGRIGKVLSSETRAFGGTTNRDVFSPGLAYFAERDVGGNPYTIAFAHLFDMVQFVVGYAKDIKSTLQLQRPVNTIRDPATGEMVGTVTSNVPDLFIATGSLPGTKTVQDGATLSIHFRRGEAFKGEPALVWHINGERGEIRLTSPDSPMVQAFGYMSPVTIQVHEFATDEVHDLPWAWESWQKELPYAGRSMGSVYDAFAAGGDEKYPTFDDALRLHEQLESMISGWKA